MGLCTWFAIRAKREVINALTSIQYIYIYIDLGFVSKLCPPTSPPKKKQTNHFFFSLAGPCKKCSEMMAECLAKCWHDEWMSFLRVQAFYATFEGNGSVTVGFGFGLASEEFPEREKGSKIRETSGFYSSVAGETCCWGPFWETLGGFSVWG